jgi:autotransporter adhesin
MSVGAGVGSFNGEESLAVGGSYRINTNTIMKGSLATGVNGGDTAVGLGVGYSW